MRDSETRVLVVLCTCPNAEVAKSLASTLVGNALAACVNIVPAIRSVYQWKGQVQDDSESLLIIKTTDAEYASLQAWLLDHHPYEVPEVLAVRVDAGSEDYLKWLSECVGRDATD